MGGTVSQTAPLEDEKMAVLIELNHLQDLQASYLPSLALEI